MSQTIHECEDTSEACEFYDVLGLYLKPIARLNICVTLPQLKVAGRSISNWEVMEKLRAMVKPLQFTVLKVSKTTLEFIRFEAEMESRTLVQRAVSQLEGSQIKLSGFTDMLKVRSCEAKIPFPTRHDWDSYFRDAKNMDEMKPGERPDTIHIEGLPIRWFMEGDSRVSSTDKPSHRLLQTVFNALGNVRRVEIPSLDDPMFSKRNAGKISVYSHSQDLTFEAYIQYCDYVDFVKAMDALRGMKLMLKTKQNLAYVADIKVDFDKSKYMNDANIHKRIVEIRKIAKLQKEKDERIKREREAEERRKEEEKKRLRREEEAQERERRRREEREREERMRKEAELSERRRKEAERLCNGLLRLVEADFVTRNASQSDEAMVICSEPPNPQVAQEFNLRQHEEALKKRLLQKLKDDAVIVIS